MDDTSLVSTRWAKSRGSLFTGNRTDLIAGVDQTVGCQPLNRCVKQSTARKPGHDFAATFDRASEGLSERCTGVSEPPHVLR